MDPALPSFILGYHGCDAKVAEQVFAGRDALRPSQNNYDWLGKGIYFWEHNAQRAYEFAQVIAKQPHPSDQSIREPAVIGAIIDLGYCLNLLDSRFIRMVRDAYLGLKTAMDVVNEPMPRNTMGADLVNRKLDCAVIGMLHEQRGKSHLPPFDTVRAAFFEGGRLYDNAGFAARNHIQICVRNHRSIVGYFRPLDEHGKPTAFG